MTLKWTKEKKRKRKNHVLPCAPCSMYHVTTTRTVDNKTRTETETKTKTITTEIAAESKPEPEPATARK